MKIRKKWLCSLLCILLALSCAGCGAAETLAVHFEMPQKVNNLKDGVAAENDRFELSFDKANYQILLTDKQNGTVWSTTPEEARNNNPMESGKKNNPKVESPIFITYYNKTDYNDNTAIARTSAISRGKVSSEKIENGIAVTYYFKSEEVAVTVEYTLEDDHISISIDPKKIIEGENTVVEKVSIAPYFCALKNDAEDSYLFMPSGSGTLVYPNVTGEDPASVTEKIYGVDWADNSQRVDTLTQTVRLPVFGMKSGEKGIAAIVESGAESADITVTKNDKNVGFATVYTTFTVRGYTTIDVPRNFASAMKYMKLYAERLQNKMSISYYPLYGEDAGYMGIADTYRNYLENEEGLESRKDSKAPLNIKFVGGILTKANVLGISYRKMKTVTELEDVETLISQLSEKYSFSAGLYGYGASGLDIGKPAGNLTVNSKLGGVKGLKNVIKTAEQSNAELYMNFDLVQFEKSGAGISDWFDTATTSNGRRAILYNRNPVTYLQDKTNKGFYLLSREELMPLAERLYKKTKSWELGGVAFDTLSSMKYSDHSDVSYYSSGNMAKQVKQIYKAYRKSNIAVYADAANAYAAISADNISDVPIQSSKYNIYGTDIPFYQIVFGGYIPMQTSSVNLSADETKTVLGAVEGGSGLTFTVGEDFDNTLLSSVQKSFYGTDSQYVFKRIDEIMKSGFEDCYKQIGGNAITDHIIITEKVRKTTFENGSAVYVNYGDNDYVDDSVTVKANGYLLIRGDNN